MTSSNRSVALMCLSSYIPPKEKFLDAKEGQAITVKTKQGLSPVYSYLYKTANYSIGSVNRFKCFKHGHQQHVFDVSFGKKNRQFYVNHPGERAFSGENRPSYWAGNGTCPMVVQYKSLAMLMYDINPEEQVHYIHSWSPVNDYDEYRINGKYLFMRLDDSYLAAYFSEGFSLTVNGINAYKEVISQGLRHFVFVRCSDSRESGNFENFINNVNNMDVSFEKSEHRAMVKDFALGTLEYDKKETKLDGKIIPDTWEDNISLEEY